jgi:hypothetical protein
MVGCKYCMAEFEEEWRRCNLRELLPELRLHAHEKRAKAPHDEDS